MLLHAVQAALGTPINPAVLAVSVGRPANSGTEYKPSHLAKRFFKKPHLNLAEIKVIFLIFKFTIFQLFKNLGPEGRQHLLIALLRESNTDNQ